MFIFLENEHLRCVVVGNGPRKSRCFLGKKYQFPRGGGEKIWFSEQYIDPWDGANSNDSKEDVLFMIIVYEAK